ncbi:unnamed protein product [Larinioides sclopetarius]|uniref:Uncharacterized protein n=1 Tax=Larinioides sclopetarius TaxID=280406 RepID=A0AAV2BU25_9ARAC
MIYSNDYGYPVQNEQVPHHVGTTCCATHLEEHLQASREEPAPER